MPVAAEFKKQWKAVRDKYVRIKKINDSYRSGSPASAPPTWGLFSSLNFLDAHLKTRKRKK